MKNLRLYRGRKGLSQKDLSSKIGTSVNMITLLEKADYLKLSEEKLIQIAEVLNCDPFELIGVENLKFKPANDEQRIIFLKNLISSFESEDLKEQLWALLKTLKS